MSETPKPELPKGSYVAGEPFTRDELVAVCPWLAEFLDVPPPTITITSTLVRVEESRAIRLEPDPT